MYIELDSDDDYGGITGSAGVTTNSKALQSVNLIFGRDYTLSFGYSPRTSNMLNSGILFSLGTSLTNGKINAGAGTFSVDGETSASFVPTPTVVGTWSIANIAFTAAAGGKQDLVFLATGNANEYGGFIDDVKLHLVPVPLPAGVMLMLTAFGGAAAFSRLRSRRAA
jgi:hypothetical protein